MPIPLGYKRTAASCILRCGQELLLLKRFNEPYSDFFLPVAGKCEPFENPKTTAIRETLEETGIRVSAMTFCGTLVETSPTKYNWISFIYISDIERLAPPLSNEGTLHWIPATSIHEFQIPKTDGFVYDYIRAGRPFAFNADFDEAGGLVKMVEEIEGREVFP